ncbi:MAG: efflux RND transporter periplasmic adaptor subunit [FCB group bacterium]|nr:efflux RND transporter periplasmic adaptor subunit [FCB group bacterium]
MKHFSKQWYLMLILVFLLLSCEENRALETKATSITVIIPQPEVISKIVNAPCRLEASQEAVISSSAPGRISKVNFSEGDYVREGDVLVELATDRQYTGAITIAAAGVSAARSVYENARYNLERGEYLIQSGAISQREYDLIENSAVVAESSLRAAQVQYMNALALNESGIITAPFGGTVSRVWVREGEMASGRIMSITNSGGMTAELFLSEKHLPDLRVGLPVFFTTEHYPGELFTGTVLSHTFSVDAISGLVSVTVQFDNTDDRLVSGMTGIISVALKTIENAVVLPQRALLAVDSNSWQVAVCNNGIAEIHPVQIGIRNGTLMEITAGVAYGDSIISLGNHIVRDGESVEVIR